MWEPLPPPSYPHTTRAIALSPLVCCCASVPLLNPASLALIPAAPQQARPLPSSLLLCSPSCCPPPPAHHLCTMAGSWAWRYTSPSRIWTAQRLSAVSLMCLCFLRYLQHGPHGPPPPQATWLRKRGKMASVRQPAECWTSSCITAAWSSHQHPPAPPPSHTHNHTQRHALQAATPLSPLPQTLCDTPPPHTHTAALTGAGCRR